MSESFRGPLLWQESWAIPMPRSWFFVIAFGLMAFGAVVVYFAERLISRMENPWSNPVAWIMVVSIAFFELFGCWVLYCGIAYRVLKGTHFYLKGVEVGEGDERSFVPYAVLEFLKVDIVPPPTATEKAINIALIVLAVLAMRPAGIAAVIGRATKERIYCEISLRPRGRNVLSYKLTRSEHDRLAPIFNNR